MNTADVVVVGAGVLGLSTAYWLAKTGSKVVVLDKGRTAWEASGRASGYLSLRGETPIEARLAAVAEKLWHSLDDELGYVTEWCSEGRLWAAFPYEWEAMQETYKSFSKTDFPFRLIDGDEARSLLPYLSDSVVGAIHTTHGGHANPQRTAQAFAWACMDRGVVIRENAPVLSIRTSGGKIVGVVTPDGEIATPIVVNCAGPGAGKIAEMIGAEVPVAAARLEAMVTAPLPPMFKFAMIGNGVSVRQTHRGNLHFNGGPHEWIDVDLTSEPVKPTTPIIRNAARRVAELLPSAKNIPLLRCWGGVIDLTPDHSIVIDRVPGPDGMFVSVASGHGFGLAPAIGKALAELTLTGDSTIPIRELGLSRFANLPKDWRKQFNWEAGNYNT
ncbi:FAD-binding oxidoreductase [Paraburkholderia phymatum]|uniref:FAD dependent oxidoreductase n=1 Tax=Paraburkholderia phymatum (strain DSM 17167 / CIP 108236 / LMG 21445 / STM815) TaxID=391038 RepID=B2JSB9_PARP8|nr:FAD-binding oxidoreductase [Paraburkholderia phymatum]ACC73939.1 FAD dependent oxidoreductase [Paraburkholderia phymatum STM815]